VRRAARVLAPLSAALVAAVAAPAPSVAAGPSGPGLYDPSSPAGSQYADPFERGRTAGGAPAVAVPGSGPPTAAPPSRPASAVGAFGAGVTPRRAGAPRTAAPPAARRRVRARLIARDRALASSELAGIGAAPTGALLEIGGLAALVVLGVAAAGGLAGRRRRGS
jgi:hypothetical protein